MKYAFCLVVLIGFPWYGFGQTKVKASQSVYSKPTHATQTLSFDDLPKIIAERNENYRAAQSSINAQQERTGHLARSFLPRISASLGEEDVDMTSGLMERQTNWRVGASVNLYRGGRDSLDEDIRQAQLEAAKVDSTIDFRKELRRARASFWSIVALEKTLNHRQEELRKNEENLRSARRRAGAGVASNADANQFELYGMELEQKIKQLNHQADVERNRLAVLLGMSEHKGLKLRTDFPEVNIGKAHELNIENQVDFKLQKTKVRIEELRAKQSGRWWIPEVDLYAYHGVPSLRDDLTQNIRDDRETVVGIRMSLDFGNGFGDMIERKARIHEARSGELRAAYTAREVIATDHEIRHDMSLSIELLADNEKSISKAREFLKTTQSEYSRGIKNGPDLLGAFRQLYDLLDRSVELNRDLLVAQADLDSLISKEESL